MWAAAFPVLRRGPGEGARPPPSTPHWCFYLSPPVRWKGSEEELAVQKRETVPTSGSSFGPFLCLSRSSSSGSLEGVSGGVRWETSCWKGTPERFTLESRTPLPQHPSALVRYRNGPALAGLNFLALLLLSDVRVCRVVYPRCLSSWSRLLR